MTGGAENGRVLLRSCVVGGVTFCLDARRVREVAKVEHVQVNPAAGLPFGWLLGREDEAEVFSLAHRLGLSPAPEIDGQSAVLLLDAAPSPFGLLVDRVLPDRDIAAAEILDLPAWTQNRQAGFFEGLLPGPEGPSLVLATERLHPETLPIVEPVLAGETPEPPRARPAGRDGRGRLLAFVTDPEILGAGTVLGLSARQVVELCEMPRCTPVPSGPDFLQGVTSYREEALPVIDLGVLLGFEPSEIREGQKLLVARGTRRGTVVGIGVDRRIELLSPPFGFRAAPRDRACPATRGSYERGEVTLIVPDLDAVAGPMARP